MRTYAEEKEYRQISSNCSIERGRERQIIMQSNIHKKNNNNNNNNNNNSWLMGSHFFLYR